MRPEAGQHAYSNQFIRRSPLTRSKCFVLLVRSWAWVKFSLTLFDFLLLPKIVSERQMWRIYGLTGSFIPYLAACYGEKCAENFQSVKLTSWIFDPCQIFLILLDFVVCEKTSHFDKEAGVFEPVLPIKTLIMGVATHFLDKTTNSIRTRNFLCFLIARHFQ